jgi:hypothetical protein
LAHQLRFVLGTRHSEVQTLFRITPVNGTRAGEAVKLRVEGQIGVSTVNEFIRACHEHAAHCAGAELDLTGVTFIDDAAATAIRKTVSEDVRITSASPFVQAVLKEVSL